MVNILALKNVRDIQAVAAVIREKRRHFHLSQAALAEMVNVSQPYISKIEKGHAEDVPMNLIINILENLGVDIFVGKIENN